jgi:hypothetical protein
MEVDALAMLSLRVQTLISLNKNDIEHIRKTLINIEVQTLEIAMQPLL